jgi:hypothetical protein
MLYGQLPVERFPIRVAMPILLALVAIVWALLPVVLMIPLWVAIIGCAVMGALAFIVSAQHEQSGTHEQISPPQSANTDSQQEENQ